MRRLLLLPVLVGLSDAVVTWGVKITFGIICILVVLGIVAQWIVCTRLEEWRTRIRVPEDTSPLVDDPVVVDNVQPGDYWVGLMSEGVPVGKRVKGKVVLDDGIRFPRTITLPSPLDSYDAIGVWETDPSHAHPPLVTVNTWLVEVSDDGERVVIGG